MLFIARSTQFLKVTALAITPFLVSPLAAVANPLEMMEGWVYTVTSSSAFGVEQQGLPEGLVGRGGVSVGDVFEDQPYSIGLFDYQGQLMLSFEQLLMQRKVTRDGVVVNEQFREILDSAISSQYEGFQFTCQVNGQNDPEIVAIATVFEPYVDKEWITEFQGVWRANRETRQLEPIAPDNIRCLNIFYGYDG
ncbi:MAG: hypothetical protein HC799_11835 [Limnothrix sp. RL_2_0]|nr:hypothetical protein [Limnothrix sp. RL_2_0]